VWIRTDRTRQVALRVAPTAEELPGAAPVAYRYPGPSTDFTTVFEVSGLGSEQTWAYDLTVDGVTHGPWSLVSGPADGAPGVRRIAFGSCTKDDEQPIFEDIRAEDPDLFLFVGDNHYANSDDLDSLRQFYRWAHARSGRAELLHETSVYATWDDHDYVGNNTDGTASGKDVALRAFKEYWANGSYGLDDLPGVFSSHTYGDIGIWLVDDRYYRGEDDSLLGLAQEAWLLESVAASPATFKLVACGSQWNMESTDDSWAVYPEAQSRVVNALSEIGGVVLLSGDVHFSELVSVPASAYDIPELTSSPLANDGRAKVVYIDIDTTVADPTMDVRIVDDDGVVQDTLSVTRSQLE
jgi:alkaline phosphatase D